jgi:signal transduction histidine kinase
VSLGLIESHRGTIRLESRAGGGTTVEIRIPATDELPEAAPAAAVETAR